MLRIEDLGFRYSIVYTILCSSQYKYSVLYPQHKIPSATAAAASNNDKTFAILHYAFRVSDCPLFRTIPVVLRSHVGNGTGDAMHQGLNDWEYCVFSSPIQLYYSMLRSHEVYFSRPVDYTEREPRR